MKKSFFTLILSVIVSALAAYGVVRAATPTNVQQPAGSENLRAVNLNLSDYPDFTFAAENSVEAVVFIKVTIAGTKQAIPADPFFRFFFGDQGYTPRDRQASGSGVIIREDGYIVTNNHVVDGASKIEVTLNNNKTFEASVIGTDPATDVALIKIEASGLPVLSFGDSDNLRLGEWVLAIGSPLGEELRSTITAGIVSAKGRSMPNYDGQFKIESFIQTDAAVNPGNSGGALVNKEGQLVGINTAIVSTTGSYTGYSFAVPSNIVSKIVGDLIDFGSVKRAKLGISMTSIDEKKAEELKLSSLDGVYIGEVAKGGAADKAGVKAGDVLVAIDGKKVKNAVAVQEKVNGYHPGDTATVSIIRDGVQKDLEVVFTGYDDVKNGETDVDGTTAFYGARLRDLDKKELASLGLKHGVYVENAGNGAFAKAGGTDGLVIVYVNNKTVSSVKDVVDTAKNGERAVYIQGIKSDGNITYFGFGKE